MILFAEPQFVVFGGDDCSKTGQLESKIEVIDVPKYLLENILCTCSISYIST